MSISGQIYVTVADKIFLNEAEGFSELLSIIKNEIYILKSQKRPLNAGMNHILIKSLKYGSLKDKHLQKLIKFSEDYLSLTRKKVAHYSVVTIELEKALAEVKPEILGKRTF